MPQFSNQPPKDPKGYGLDLIRTPANGKLILAITSHEMIGCPTHWFGGRTVPCETVNCRACLEGIPWRWHGYVAGIVPNTRHQFIAEFTAQACEKINEYSKTHPSLRNAILTARRLHNKRNGRVVLTIATGDPDKLHLPDAPDMIKCLSILWNIPTPGIKNDRKKKNFPALAVQTGGNHETIAAAIAAEHLHG